MQAAEKREITKRLADAVVVNAGGPVLKGDGIRYVRLSHNDGSLSQETPDWIGVLAPAAGGQHGKQEAQGA